METLDGYSDDSQHEAWTLGRLIDALESEVSVVSISGQSTVLVELFCKYLVNGCCHKLVDYPCFYLRLFES